MNGKKGEKQICWYRMLYIHVFLIQFLVKRHGRQKEFVIQNYTALYTYISKLFSSFIAIANSLGFYSPNFVYNTSLTGMR